LDSAANPYLAFALLLSAGLKGIEEDYELPPEAEDNVWALSEIERNALGMKELPGSLNQAIIAMERSELVAETLGEHVFDFFLRNKKAEWSEYRQQVSQWELNRYLPSL
jgi:glutamine synthetase